MMKWNSCKCESFVHASCTGDFSHKHAVVINANATYSVTTVDFVLIVHWVARLYVAKLFIDLAELIADHLPFLLHDFGP